MKRRTLIIAGAGTLLVSACGSEVEAKETIQLYKLASCGCCSGWAAYMEEHGYEVETHEVASVDPIKREHGIPAAAQSCHTALVGGYAVEGHVPVEMVDRLLKERPNIDGIALPRMPAGSAGMPGRKRGVWTIYAIKDGKTSLFERI